MKKFLILFSLLLLQASASKLHVKSLEEYNTILPNQTLKVEVIEDGFINDIPIVKGDIINCSLKKVKAPKRAKRDAVIYFDINSYIDSKGEHKFSDKVIAKYAKTVMSKERIKEISPKEAAVKTVSTVGGFFVNGFSQAVSFVDGAVKNEEEGRIKSGLKEVYDDSVLSYIEYGQEIMIKKNDKFYLIIKNDKD